MELTYTQCGDYLIPNLVLADTQEYHIGKYGRMRRAYLKEYRPALYVISRIAGKGKDRRLEPGDYYLSDAEQADLQTLDESGLPVVLLLNAGGPVELTGLLDGMQHLDAILQLSQLGQQGGQAVADVLLGRAVPEGKLTATWARRYDDIPCARAFGSLNGDVSQDTYRDGVYVGYRYFDSFGVRPLFAFGFGLSYTTFALRAAGLAVQPGRLAVQVEVANTGARFAGREVAQVYLSAPQGELPRERRRLAGFAKTRRLAPGETQTLTLEIPQKQLAAFHPEQNAWVVDAGLYGVWVGNSSDALCLCALLEVDAAVMLERTHPICPPQHPIEELGAAPGAQDWEAALWRQKAEYNLPVYKFVPVAPPAPAPATLPLAEGEVDSLVPLLYGNITAGASTLGSAGIRVPGSAGETFEALEASRQIPSLIMADGPAGLRLRQCYQADRATGEVYGAGVLGSLENGFLEAPPRHESADTYYQFCTAFPVGTALAQSWDPDLPAQVSRAVSREMDEFHVDLWLAPGMNIQRNPLCGRNFEYYSEDPLLTGTLAAAITAGVQESGRHGVTLKHFACNTTRRTTVWRWTRGCRSAPCGKFTCAGLRSRSKPPPRPPSCRPTIASTGCTPPTAGTCAPSCCGRNGALPAWSCRTGIPPCRRTAPPPGGGLGRQRCDHAGQPPRRPGHPGRPGRRPPARNRYPPVRRPPDRPGQRPARGVSTGRP